MIVANCAVIFNANRTFVARWLLPRSDGCCPIQTGCCPVQTAAAPFRRLHAKFNIRRKHHLHRKAHILPCELSNAYALLISRSDTQCFSHEDGCFAPVTKCKRSPSELVRDVHTLIIVAAGNELLSSPSELVRDVHTLIIVAAGNELLSSPSELLQDLLHGNGSRLRDKFSSIEDQLVPLLEAGVTARGDDPALTLYHDYICLAGNVEIANPPAYVGMLTF